MDHAIHDDNHGFTSILTPEEIRKIGLKLVGFKRRRIQRDRRKTNFDRFKGFFRASKNHPGSAFSQKGLY
jgi:hypothetical protein